jgi:hypothetical protein
VGPIQAQAEQDSLPGKSGGGGIATDDLLGMGGDEGGSGGTAAGAALPQADLEGLGQEFGGVDPTDPAFIEQQTAALKRIEDQAGQVQNHYEQGVWSTHETA